MCLIVSLICAIFIPKASFDRIVSVLVKTLCIDYAVICMLRDQAHRAKTKRIKSEFGRNTCKYIPIFEVQFIPSFGKAYVCVRQTTWLCYPCDLAL